MATPTPGSASKRPGGGVSTPSHLNQSSPAPRSVPSPNAARHHPAGKTPVNHPTAGSSHGSKTVSSTPMVQNLSQSGNSASPGLNALGTPGLGGLGIEGITPSALHNISTPLAFAMSRTDSEMRMASSAVKRNEDEERRVKMRKVLKNIGRPKGKVSEEGIARLARRVGLVSDIDDEKLTQEERDRKVGNRSFSVAGDNVIVDFDLRDQVPQGLQVSGDVAEPEKAARVLLHDLKDSGDVPLTVSLNRFALNLGYLATVDRLKKETDTDCFAAVGGLYRSLLRLYEKECEAVIANLKVGSPQADSDATCKKSGRPMIHARQQLGLCLDYWQQSRYSRRDKVPAESKMDVDDAQSHEPQIDKPSTWTLLIGAEKCNTAKMPYVPLRVSDQWLPDPIELPSEDSGETVKWLEPSDEHEGLSRPCFVATLEPPVVLPYGTADAILKSFNVQNVPDVHSIPSYISLLLSTASGSHVTPPPASAAFSSLVANQDVISIRDEKPLLVQHSYTLDNAKPDFGFLLRELPFSHPKQLVELMPTLRQWAGFGVLLSQSFEAGFWSSITSALDRTRLVKPEGQAITLENIRELNLQGKDDRASLTVNMALSTTPQPTLNITFRSASEIPSVANVDIQILRNADVAIEIHDGFGITDDEAKSKAEAKLARALDVCWDLGVWIEWVRGQFG